MISARSAPSSKEERLRQKLLALDYPAFARCVCVLMEDLGYEKATLAGRREWKGYNRAGGGGWDIEAVLPGGLAPRRVIAQVKQFGERRVHQRSVDELRGACLRAGAAEALLVTTSAFSAVARRSAQASGQSIPVRLLDGRELAGLLARFCLGAKERRGAASPLKIDETFFTNPPLHSPLCPQLDPSARWQVCVRISRGPLRGGRWEGGG